MFSASASSGSTAGVSVTNTTGGVNLAFTIPPGATGPQGIQGEPGADGNLNSSGHLNLTSGHICPFIKPSVSDPESGSEGSDLIGREHFPPFAVSF